MKGIQWLSVLLLPLTVAANSTVYQSRDANGTVVFSSKPSPGAKPIIIPSSPMLGGAGVKSEVEPKVLPLQAAKSATPPIEYKVSITAKSQIIYRSQNGSAIIPLKVIPQLTENYTVELELTDYNGNKEINRQRGPLPIEELSFLVKATTEGRYTIQARVLSDNDENKVIAQSPVQTIYIRLHRPPLLKK